MGLSIKQLGKGVKTFSRRRVDFCGKSLSLPTLMATVCLMVGSLWTILAFMSDAIRSSGSANSGNLHIGALLEIDGNPGSLASNPRLTTSNDSDSRCDSMNCGGQNQGLTSSIVQPNTIHTFSYTLTNRGTVDYINYTGDQIAAWVKSDYAPTDPSFVSLLPSGVGIGFDGSNYINTEIMSGNNLTATANAQQDCGALVSLGSTEYLFGVYYADNNFYVSSSTTGLSCLLATQTWHAGIGSGTSANLGLNLLSSGNAATFVINSGSTTGTFSADGEPVCSGIIVQDCTIDDAHISTPAPIFLGRANGSTDGFSGVINSFSLLNDTSNQLLANYQPAAQCHPSAQTMVFGFWDTVSEQFITPTAGSPFSTSIGLSYTEACSGTIVDPGSTGPAPANPMKVLLFPASVSDDTINSELNAMLAGSAKVAPSAISTIDGSDCSAHFSGTDDGIAPVCMTGVLTSAQTGLSDTLGIETAPKKSLTYNYKFVVYLPSNTPPDYTNIVINFGVSSSARGSIAINWREQTHPYISARTTGGSNPEITLTGNNQPFLDQLANDTTSKQNYLQSIVTVTDKKYGTCSFAPGNCTVTITDDGFDPSKVGVYNVEYTAINDYGNIAIVTIPVQVWNFNKITNGMYHGLALGTNGSVWTWGYNIYGQRGQGDDTSASDLPPVTRVSQSHFDNRPVVDITGSYHTSCALNSVGTVYCWGHYGDGALGNGGGIGEQPAPVSVAMPEGVTFTQINGSHSSSTGAKFAAIGSDGNIYVWGDAALSYRLGTGSTNNAVVPTKITNITNDPFVQVAHGETGGAAVTASGQVFVWGMNNQGQMAFGNTTATNATTSLPHMVDNLSNVKKVSYGGYASNGIVMALKDDGTVWTWGWGAYGMLGNGDIPNQTRPVQALVNNVRDINTGPDYTQYIVGNDIWSAGFNNFGEHFSGDIVNHYDPIKSVMDNVAGNVGMVASGYDNAWILSKDGKKVWGIGFSNLAGQEFGNEEIDNTSYDEAIPWTFVPEAIP